MEQSDGLSANRMNKISMCLRGKYCEGSMAQYRTVAFVEAGSYNFELYIPTFYKGRRLTAAVKTARLSWADQVRRTEKEQTPKTSLHTKISVKKEKWQDQN